MYGCSPDNANATLPKRQLCGPLTTAQLNRQTSLRHIQASDNSLGYGQQEAQHAFMLRVCTLTRSLPARRAV